ncbi:MAG: hypothetical protein ABWZ77_04395 [Naasia sp.]
MPSRSRGDDRPARTDDEIALERYRYLLRTAPPEKLEEVHAEAFAKLTPEQRRQVYEDLSSGGERPAGEDPGSLARSATRAEVANPGTMERTFAGRGQGGGPSFGSMVGSSLLGTVAGYVIGSALVSAFLPDPGVGDTAAGADEAGANAGDAGADAGADAGGDGGWGDGGFGGGDFGGGDFGGGDFGGGFDV